MSSTAKNNADTYAELTTWNGIKITIKIEPEWIDDMVCAVKSQITIINNLTGLSIRGGDFSNIVIFKGVRNAN